MFYKIIENLIPVSFQNEIENFCTSDKFPYYFQEKIKYNPEKIKYKNKNIIDAPGFSHVVFDWQTNSINSPYYDRIVSILYFLEEKTNIVIDKIKRIRIRKSLQFPNHDKNKYTPPHTDLDTLEQYYSLVYYVNNSDGDTFLFDYKNESKEQPDINIIANQLVRVSPKKGRGFLFEGKILHAGNCPINYEKRIIINFDFTIK